jgi:hypothetical protein
MDDQQADGDRRIRLKVEGDAQLGDHEVVEDATARDGDVHRFASVDLDHVGLEPQVAGRVSRVLRG